MAKSGLAAYEDWARTAYGAHSPWGGEDTQPLVTATLRAVTDCVVAVAGRDQVDRDRLAELAAPRHREDIPDR